MGDMVLQVYETGLEKAVATTRLPPHHRCHRRETRSVMEQ
jgi:hypothetical protein